MNPEIARYSVSLSENDREICQRLMSVIEQRLPQATSKVWHGSPAWFIDENPIVGYCKLKSHVQLLFWSGQSFEKAGLAPVGKFKAAEARYTDAAEIDPAQLADWLSQAERIQWITKTSLSAKGSLSV